MDSKGIMKTIVKDQINKYNFVSTFKMTSLCIITVISAPLGAFTSIQFMEAFLVCVGIGMLV